MANPPPPYANITGITRTIMKDNQEETIANYDGNARPGELVVDLNNYNIYIGDTDGNLNLINTGGGSGNSEPAGNVGAIQLNAGGNLFGASANLSFANNTFTTANVIPVEDNTYFLGDETHRWANLWLGPGTIYITDSNLASNLTAELTVLDGVLQINGADQLQVGQLKFVDNTIESTTGNIDIEIGVTGSSADLLLNRNTVVAAGKTFTAGNITANAVRSSASNNYLELNSANLGFIKLGTENAGPIELAHGNNTWSFSGTTLTLPVSPPSPDRPDSEIYAESMLISTGDGDLTLRSAGNIILDVGGTPSITVANTGVTLNGSQVISTGYQDGNVNPSTPTLLDTTKQVHTLADSWFRLADGAEGQICHFAMNDASASAEDIYIVVNHLRISQSGAANVRANATWQPFPFGSGNFVATLATAIFTDGAWSVNRGTIV